MAEDNQQSLKEADMVVAATSNREHNPTVIDSRHSMRDDVVLLTLATKEAPYDLVQHILNGNGLALCDDTHCVFQRCHQSLVLYLQEQGIEMEEALERFQIFQFCDLTSGKVQRIPGMPVLISASGQAAADARLGAAIFEAHAAARAASS